MQTDYYTAIEASINKLFLDALYKPLLKAMRRPAKELTNAISDQLYTAVANGRVEYDGTMFSGQFNAAISKRLRALGATWRKTGWYLAKGLVPPEIMAAAALADSRYKAIVDSIFKVLDTAGDDLDRTFADSSLEGDYFKTVSEMNAAFVKSVQGVAIAPELTIAARRMIAQQWGQNLNIYVKDWAGTNILKLRQQVQANAFAGNRAGALVKTIQDNYSVSRNKAKFLARQETSLLMSKLRETRYNDVGSTTYIWRGAMDERERPDHKALEGKVCSWASPPVVDRATGRRAHPGEDFGCRCYPEPVIQITDDN
jgi:SPP1 gp7 family putative phage head morphogenesis protein